MSEQEKALTLGSADDAPRMVASKAQVRPLVLSDFQSMWKFAGCLASSGMLPKSYIGKDIENLPPDKRADALRAKAVVAIQMGAEVGLTPMQAIQNIAVINGMPSIWGDAQLALVKNSGLMESYSEEVQGEGQAMTAVVKAKRKGENEIVRRFSWADATRAKLTSRDTYIQFPQRMLTYRARAFALRDAFPDVLKGLTHTWEEAESIDVTPKNEISATDKAKVADINAVLATEADKPVEAAGTNPSPAPDQPDEKSTEGSPAGVEIVAEKTTTVDNPAQVG